jgi:hypothetical protein
MRIPSGKTDQVIYFVAVDPTDLKSRETGLSSFTVHRSRNGGAATAYTTPTVAELSAANMPGVYSLLIDEDTTIAAGSDSEEYVVHITQASMAPVTRSIELYRRDTTSGQTITVANGAADADIERLQGSLIATPTTAGVLEVDVTHWLGTAAATPTVAGVPEVDVTHWIGTAAATPTVAGVPEVDVTHFNGVAGTFSGGRPEVNTSHAAGTAWNSGAIGAATIATGAIDADAIADNAIDAGAIAAGAITAAKFAAGAIDAAALATDAAGEIADAVWDEDATAHQTTGTFGQAIGDPVADTNTIYGAVVTGAAGATVAADIIAIQADTDNIQTRLPASLVSGRIDASVGAMATDTLTAAALAADAVTEIQSGLATSAALATVQADTDDIQTRLPAALVSGRMDASVGAMAANTLTASALAADAVDEILDDVVEGTTTVRQMLRGFASALLSKLSGGGTGTEIFRDIGDTKDRITATVDASGNRTAITLDLT